MTQDHSDWLPFDALTIPAVTSAFEPVVETWSQRWFGESRAELGRVRPQQGGRSLNFTNAEWRAFGHGIFIDWGNKTQLAVAGQCLQIDTRQHKLSPDDENLMLIFAQRIADDLAAAFAVLVGDEKSQTQAHVSHHPFEISGGLELQISAGPDTAFKVGISAPALTRLRKSQCSRHVPARMPDTPLVDILGPVKVGYSANLGSAVMSALDLHNMTAGDIVILDRALAMPIDIIAEQSGRLLLKAVLGQNDGHLALTAHKFEGSVT